MGCDNVIPGVSGWIMVFILDTYEEFLVLVRNLVRLPFLKAIFRRQFARAWRKATIVYLALGLLQLVGVILLELLANQGTKEAKL